MSHSSTAENFRIDDHGFGLDDVVRPRQPVDEHRSDVAVVRHHELGRDVGAAGDDGDEPRDVDSAASASATTSAVPGRHRSRTCREMPSPQRRWSSTPVTATARSVEQLLATAGHRGLRGPDGGRHLLPRGPPVQLERSDDALIDFVHDGVFRHVGNSRCWIPSLSRVWMQQ